MSLREALLPEFDQEMAATRKTLERIADDKLAWKPHPKSMTMGGLATHLTALAHWAVTTIEQDSLDLAPGGVPAASPAPVKSRSEALAAFDRNVAEARAAIARAHDEHLMKPWTLLMNGKSLFSMPRIAVLRTFVMNHIIHHRAQLGVFLRMNDIAVPAIYGPSADEATGF